MNWKEVEGDDDMRAGIGRCGATSSTNLSVLRGRHIVQSERLIQQTMTDAMGWW